MPDLPKDGRTYRIWSVVEQLILSNYDQISDERMRDSYYLLREWLDPLREEGEILEEEYVYFAEHYEYYRDDFWPRIEERHGIERPLTKPPTVVIEDGTEYTEEHIFEAWDRARGFIFVEKSGMAADLKPLSNHGWLIVAAQGESTRTFREKAANDGTDRPILVVTDADFYGGGITESLKGHSDRTEHLNLDLALEHRVQELGLTQRDADALELPRERDPTQSPDKWRTELNSLAVLKEREGIDDPLLSYVAAKMAALNIPLAPLPLEETEQEVRNAVRSAVNEALADSVDELVEEVMDRTEPVEDIDQSGEGPLTELRVKPGDLDSVSLEPVRDELLEAARSKRDRLVWWRRSQYEEDVKEEIGAEAVDQLSETLPGR